MGLDYKVNQNTQSKYVPSEKIKSQQDELINLIIKAQKLYKKKIEENEEPLKEWNESIREKCIEGIKYLSEGYSCSRIEKILEEISLYNKKIKNYQEVAEKLPWKYDIIKKIINPKKTGRVRKSDGRSIAELTYEQVSQIISKYNKYISKVPETSVVREISENTDFLKATIRKYLKLYGLIAEEGTKGGERKSLKGKLGTGYNDEQVRLIITSFYETRGDINEAVELINAGWKISWLEKIPTNNKIVNICKKVGLEKDKEPPPLEKLLKKYNLPEVPE